MGGYFICNGIERIIRLLILQRRHYIMALRRSAYQKRGSNYTDSATLIRCVVAVQWGLLELKTNPAGYWWAVCCFPCPSRTSLHLTVGCDVHLSALFDR